MTSKASKAMPKQGARAGGRSARRALRSAPLAEDLTQVYQKDHLLDSDHARNKAIGLIAGLEGAMLMSKSLGDNGIFEQVAAQLSAQ